MNIIERGRVFVQSLKELLQRTVWDWKRCPRCRGMDTCKWGFYTRHPWTLHGRKVVPIQRHYCNACRGSYSEEHPGLVRGSWYGREVHRCAVDHWQHGRTSLRRAAELVRSWIGRQERWLMWHPWVEGEGEGCTLCASTIHRWLDQAGEKAEQAIEGQMAGIPCSYEMGTDGLWVRLRGGVKRVMLILEDSVSGVVWSTVVVQDEEHRCSWAALFRRAAQAGLELCRIQGVTSDGALGLTNYLQWVLILTDQQRCVLHLWQNLSRPLAQAVRGLTAKVAEVTRQELRVLIHGVLDAVTYEQAEGALAKLQAHPQGGAVASFLQERLKSALIHLQHEGLLRVSPEWRWRDYRQRLSRGRNHGSDQRQERAGLVWSTYHNFTPAQERKERKRQYRHPGQSPLEAAGASPGAISYLDALGI
jgi:hypothetical protein